MPGSVRNLIGILALLALWPIGSLSALAQSPAEERPRVLYIIAADSIEDAKWYEGLVEHSQAAADALNIELEQMFAGTVRPVVLARVNERLESGPKPDYLVFGNQRSLGVELLQTAEAHEIDAFLYIAPLLDEDVEAVGHPREKLAHWIGQLIPDDEQAGYDLANVLIEDARHRKTRGRDSAPIRVVGIAGRKSTTSSQQRQAGLLRAVSEHQDVELLQVVSARWKGDVAGRKYKLLRQRYGDIDVVWSANDPMALGIVEAIEGEETPPSVGGVDWIAPALDAVSDGKLLTTLGGHNFDIAYVMSLLRFHHDGIDFADVAGTASLRSHLEPLTPDNISTYLDFLELKEAGRVDYAAGLSSLLDDPETLENLSIRHFIVEATKNGGERPS